MTRKQFGILALVLYISTIYGANWLLNEYGVVSVGFGLMAPAGVFAAGLAFTFRDLTQSLLGKGAALLAIAVGALASATVSPEFAVASAVAFSVSELADFGVYTPLLRRGWVKAVVASNVVGLVLDSTLFLQIAFGNLDFMRGQIVGKAWMTLLAVALLVPVRKQLAVVK